MPQASSLAPTIEVFQNRILAIASTVEDPASKRIFQEVISFHDSEERLRDCLPTLVSDLGVLHQFAGLTLDPSVVEALQVLVSGVLTLPSVIPERVRPLDLVTKEILRRPLLTPTDFRLFNVAIQALGSEGPLDIAGHLSPRYPEYYRYGVINELRRAFSCVAHVITRWCLVDRDVRFRGWVAQLFQESGPLDEMVVFQKATLALRLQKNLEGFRNAHQVSTSDFEKLLARLGQVLGPSGSIFFTQVRAIYACENWMGVTSVDLAVKRIAIKRPDLGVELKAGLVRWKDNLVEMQARQKQIRDIAFSWSSEIELAPDVYQELLVSMGTFTDFLGTLGLVKDLLKRLRVAPNDRLFALVVNLLLRNLVTDIRKYQCWGNGEYNNNEKLIQATTLEICLDFQRILRSGAKREEFLALEVFWGAVFVYRELLAALYGEKHRDYLKASEKDALADTPATPNRLYLFEKTHAAGAKGTRVGLVPILKAWDPYVRYYQLRNEGVENLLKVDREKVQQHLGRWLSREV